MRKVRLMFGIHLHQPVGNFGWVMEKAFEDCYRPFLSKVAGFPFFRFNLHISGPLLEWLECEQPSFIDSVAKLVRAGRIEMLGGGFYEPILPAIPEEDGRGQIELMSDRIEALFGSRPAGIWLAERVWDPRIPKLVSNLGVRYTLLDDTHFLCAGLEAERVGGYYVTEEAGFPLGILPIEKRLRYTIPFKPPQETLDVLRETMDRGVVPAVTFADDGEKFGVWPGTRDWVYGQGWLESFLEALQENRNWISTLHCREFIESHPPMGRIYIPNASYEEMSEWAMPVDSIRRYKRMLGELRDRGKEHEYRQFLRGGYWNSFLAKYDEANHLHKRMLLVSGKVNAPQLLPLRRSAREAWFDAARKLWKGQCNCAYWHGLFGGLYLNYLRHAVYSNLIDAENSIEKLVGQTDDLTMERFDFDLDGHEEVLVTTPALKAIIAPSRGGAMMELDYRPKCFNLVNLMRRRREAYHQILEDVQRSHGEPGGSKTPISIHQQVTSKQSGLGALLGFDRFGRFCFIDHFFTAGTSLADYRAGTAEELGDFADGEYEIEHGAWTARDLKQRFLLTRTGTVATPGNGAPVRIEKAYIFEHPSCLKVEYRIGLLSGPAVDLWFGVELNMTLLAGNAPDRYYVFEDGSRDTLDAAGDKTDVSSVQAVDEWTGMRVRIKFGCPARLWFAPVETVSQSEEGLESHYQGFSTVASWKQGLNPGDDFVVSASLFVESL